MLVAAGSRSSIVLLDRGEVAFSRMLAAIGGATTSIHLEVYAMSARGVGAQFVTALVAAAKRGVRVRVVIDAWGTGRVASSIVAKLRASGCEAIVYNPLWRGLFSRARRRNHRKLLVVDDRVAFVGGFNVVDDFVGERAWVDVGVEIHGAACATLAQRLRREPAGDRDHELQILLSDVGGGRKLRRCYLRAIGGAQRQILLAHSYFLPDRAMLRSLTASARRGVEIALLVPGRSDVPLARATTALIYRRLLAAGVRIFELDGTILHSKLGIFDGERLLVGSFNLDPYSLADLEVLVDARDAKAGAAAVAWFDEHVRRAHLVTEARPAGGVIQRLFARLKGELGLWLAHLVYRLMARR